MFSPSSFSRIKTRKIYARGGDIRRVICQKNYISCPLPRISLHMDERHPLVAKGNRNERFLRLGWSLPRAKSSRFNCDYYYVDVTATRCHPSICVVVARYALRTFTRSENMTKALWQPAPTRILCHRWHIVRRPYDRTIANEIHAFIRFHLIRWNRDARANYGNDLCYPISPIAFFFLTVLRQDVHTPTGMNIPT